MNRSRMLPFRIALICSCASLRNISQPSTTMSYPRFEEISEKII